MKKKFSATKKDKEDWSAFTKNPGNILNKDYKETVNNRPKCWHHWGNGLDFGHFFDKNYNFFADVVTW